MFKTIHSRKNIQLFIGFCLGVLFGFLLQKGGVTKYNVIIGQLLLTDFTVVKIMLSAVITGMIGVYLLKSFRLIELHPKPGSVGASVIGGLIFGVGFGVLGYCPGTIVGALGEGWLDALFGIIGILIGAGLFAALFPRLENRVLHKGDFGDVTLPELFKVNPWIVVIPVVIFISALLLWIEKSGL